MGGLINGESGMDSDREDHVERNEFEIELAIGQYDDDPEIRHNIYPEDSEEEAEDFRERERYFSGRSDGKLYKGQSFFNRIAVKEAVLNYALKNQRNIRQNRYDKNKVGFVFLGKGKGGIPLSMEVYCSAIGSSGKLKVRIYNEEHSCHKIGDCRLLKVSVIARLFLDKIIAGPGRFLPKTIEDEIFENWGISVTRNQAQFARAKALKWTKDEYDDRFRRIRDYGNEVVDSNPGSSMDIDCLRNSKGGDVFYRFYVYFSALKRSCKANCRPLLGIDGSFLKGKVKGQLLVALGRDAYNRIYPVARGVVGVENTDNWVWFMKKLKGDLELVQEEGHSIVSDRQKGLIEAVEVELPQIEHRHCVRHIYGNLKVGHALQEKRVLVALKK